METRTIHWSELGEVTIPGTYKLSDGSYVYVLERDIVDAQDHNFKAKLDLRGRPAGPDLVNEYEIIAIRSEIDDSEDYFRAGDPIGSKPLHPGKP